MSDALQGKRVVIVGPNRTELRAAFNALTERSAPIVSTRASNGHERIEYAGGGSIRFLTPGAVRGHSVDVVYVQGWNELTEQQRGDIIPMTAAGEGELIRA